MKIVFSLGFALGAIALTAFGSLSAPASAETAPAPAATAATAPAPVPAPPSLPQTTPSQFSQVRLGMTVLQVRTLLGQGNGVQSWTTADAGTATYQWQISAETGDRIAQVVFYNGRVVGRTTWVMPIAPTIPGQAASTTQPSETEQTPVPAEQTE